MNLKLGKLGSNENNGAWHKITNFLVNTTFFYNFNKFLKSNWSKESMFKIPGILNIENRKVGKVFKNLMDHNTCQVKI